jgi:hypothetical protein
MESTARGSPRVQEGIKSSTGMVVQAMLRVVCDAKSASRNRLRSTAPRKFVIEAIHAWTHLALHLWET